MLRKVFTTTVILLFIAQFSRAQMPSRLIFSRVTKKEGLASNTTFQVVRDKQGFLWIATQNGLQRYDGNRFLTFRHIPGDSLSISQNSLGHLFIDSKERLWVTFDRQLGIFNGLGTKGVLLAPYFAKQFSEFLTGKCEIEKEVDVKRHF